MDNDIQKLQQLFDKYNPLPILKMPDPPSQQYIDKIWKQNETITKDQPLSDEMKLLTILTLLNVDKFHPT
jgi:hypothetical protein